MHYTYFTTIVYEFRNIHHATVLRCKKCLNLIPNDIYTYISKIKGESVIDCLIDAIADVFNSQ